MRKEAINDFGTHVRCLFLHFYVSDFEILYITEVNGQFKNPNKSDTSIPLAILRCVQPELKPYAMTFYWAILKVRSQKIFSYFNTEKDL